MPNRLANETSPYLLQHKDNPVDWFPWGAEAFDKARVEEKPIFLSVGYSSCHWCHVMEHESFEDPEVAAILNKSFVSVKVDREERPDVDETYMTAVQLSTGRGGWPMSVFITPDLKPFFAATYIPKDDHPKSAGIKSILSQLARAWATARPEIQKSADEFATELTRALSREAPGTFDPFDQAFLDNIVRALGGQFDQDHGGFGDAPKFPPHAAVEFLLTYALRQGAPDDLRDGALGMGLASLERMILGGIHDQVGGGFHRYSTDREWRLPHFEKMLYDNALMLRNLARAAAITVEIDEGLSAIYERAAAGIVNWLDREMTSPEGLYYSAIDADSEESEGAFYVWSDEEIGEVLGPNADAFRAAFGMHPEGNFEDEATGLASGKNLLIPAEHPFDSFEADLARLLEARGSRTRPMRDEKILVGWNGLMIAGLVEAGQFGRAEKAAIALLEYEERHGTLPRQIVAGAPYGLGFLEDYAAFAYALFELGAMRAMLDELISQRGELPLARGIKEAEFWFGQGARLTAEMKVRFYDADRGGFYATSPEHETLFGRLKPFFDQPVPSGNSLAMRCLLAVGDVDAARKTLGLALGWMQRLPQATEALATAASPLAEVTTAREASVAAITGSSEIQLSLQPREVIAGEDGWGLAVLTLEIPEGMHVNSSNPPARWLTPTEVRVFPIAAKVEFPPSKDDAYEGTVRIPIRIAMPPAERAAEFEVRVSFQMCSQTDCLSPQEKTVSAVLLAP